MLSDSEFVVSVSYSVLSKTKIIAALGRTGECFDRAKPGGLWLGDNNYSKRHVTQVTAAVKNDIRFKACSVECEDSIIK